MNTAHVELAQGVHAYLRNGLAVVLLESQHCYFVPLRQRFHRREWAELVYELEDHVPLDAEAMATCILGTDPTSALVSNADFIARAIDGSVELEGVKVLAVMPRALLVAEAAFPKRGRSTILVASRDCFDHLVVDDGRLQSWTWHSGDELPQLLRGMQPSDSEHAILDSTGETILISTSSEQSLSSSELVQDIRIVDHDESSIKTAIDCLLDGKSDPRYSFENGPLGIVDANSPARGLQMLTAWSIAIAICLVVGAVFLRARAHRRNTSEIIAQQQSLFEQTFPGQPMPVGLVSRFESERRRLSATRDGSKVPQVGSALPVMHAFLSSIDPEARFTTSTLHFVPGQLLRFDCIAKSFEDLQRIQSSLAHNNFDMPSTGAKQTSRGVAPSWEAIAWKPTDGEIAANKGRADAE